MALSGGGEGGGGEVPSDPPGPPRSGLVSGLPDTPLPDPCNIQGSGLSSRAVPRSIVPPLSSGGLRPPQSDPQAHDMDAKPSS